MNKQPKKVTKLKKAVEQFNFTDRKLKALKPRAKSYKVRDTECPKLYLAVNRKSKKFVSFYKIRSVKNPTSTTHGEYGDITIATARKLHNRAMELARQGFNPNESLLVEDIPTIQDLVLEYVDNNTQLADRTVELYRGILRNHLSSKIFRVPFSELNEQKFIAWHKSYKDKSQVMLNCLKLLSSTFNAQPPNIKKGAENPRSIIRRRRASYKQLDKSEHYLDFEATNIADAEITRFLKYLWEITVGWHEPMGEDEEGNMQYFEVKPTQDQVYCDAIFLMLLTGLRVNAVIELQWTQVDFDKDILIAQEKGKNGEKKPRVVPLTKYTYNLLRYRQKNNKYRSKYIFPSQPIRTKKKNHPKGTKHIKNPTHMWKKLERRARDYGDEELLKKVTRHGLRRTIARLSKHLGYDTDTQRAILDQSASTVTAKNYTGGGIAKDKLREVYEECHVFFDNRLLVGGGWIIPIYIGEQDTPEEHYKDVQSPLLSLWGISEELKVDKWITSFDESGFKESKSRFSDYDKDRT